MRYLKILCTVVRVSIIGQMEYRANFLFEQLGGLLTIVTNVVFFRFIYDHVHSLAGWDIYQVYFLIATNVFVNALYNLIAQSGLNGIGDLVRKGTLDTALLKPVDIQFWLSVKEPDLGAIFQIVAGLIILSVACRNLATEVTLCRLLAYILLLVCGVVLRYSLSLIIASISFWIIRADACKAILTATLRFSGYPSEVYRGLVRVLFSTALPVAIIANVPARVFVGGLGFSIATYSLLLSICFVVLSRLFLRLGLRYYQSAGG